MVSNSLVILYPAIYNPRCTSTHMTIATFDESVSSSRTLYTCSYILTVVVAILDSTIIRKCSWNYAFIFDNRGKYNNSPCCIFKFPAKQHGNNNAVYASQVYYNNICIMIIHDFEAYLLV